jgi:hypothetical protein
VSDRRVPVGRWVVRAAGVIGTVLIAVSTAAAWQRQEPFPLWLSGWLVEFLLPRL